jgi:hypothetical protein
LTNLRELHVGVSDAGVAELQRALPECRIHRTWPP